MTPKEIEKRCIQVAESSSCKKRKVGAVLTHESQPGFYTELAVGANYNPTGTSCELPDGTTDPAVVHAEITCLANYKDKLNAKTVFSVKHAFPVEELTMFVTHTPCTNCAKALAEAGIRYEVVKSFMKFDSAKPRMALVPTSLKRAAANALTYGAKKYKVNNWRETSDVECYISALQRHMDAWVDGEANDPESGLSHLDHAAANLSFLIELQHLPKLKQ